MSRPDDGGPAFPLQEEGRYSILGLSLRDYFASAAVTGQLASALPGSIDPHYAADLAKQAYIVADALIADRKEATA